MTRRTLAVVFIAALVLWLRTAAYPVDVTEFAYVTRFGDPVATWDGGTDAGLHFKLPWPIDSTLRVDRRLQLADLPAVETLTRDPAARTVDKTITVDAYVSWRVPDAAAADRFVRTVGTPDQARRVLAPRIAGRLAAVVGTMPPDDFISVADDAAVEARAERLRRQLLGEDGTGEPLREAVRAEYGIEIVDLRVRRFGYPEAVRAGIADRIRSERARKVADYDSDGRKRAADVLSAAEKEARTVEAEAKARQRVIEGRADAEADRLRNDAHAKDPQFYAFLQKLKAYQTMLGDTRDVLLLSAKHPLFDLLLNPPRTDANAPK